MAGSSIACFLLRCKSFFLLLPSPRYTFSSRYFPVYGIISPMTRSSKRMVMASLLPKDARACFETRPPRKPCTPPVGTAVVLPWLVRRSCQWWCRGRTNQQARTTCRQLTRPGTASFCSSSLEAQAPRWDEQLELRNHREDRTGTVSRHTTDSSEGME